MLAAQALEMDNFCILLSIEICNGMRISHHPCPIFTLLQIQKLAIVGSENLVKIAREVISTSIDQFSPQDLAKFSISTLCQLLTQAVQISGDKSKTKATSSPLVAAVQCRGKISSKEAHLVLGCARKVKLNPNDIPLLARIAHQQNLETLTTNFFIPELVAHFNQIEKESFMQLPFKILLEILDRDDLNISSENEVFEFIRYYVRNAPSQLMSRQNAEQMWQRCRLLWVSQDALQDICMDETVPPKLVRFVLAGISCMQSGIESLLSFTKECTEDSWRHCLVPRKLEHLYVRSASFSSSLHLQYEMFHDDQTCAQEIQSPSHGDKDCLPIDQQQKFSFKNPGSALAATTALEKYELIDDYMCIAERESQQALDKILFSDSQVSHYNQERIAYHFWLWDNAPTISETSDRSPSEFLNGMDFIPSPDTDRTEDSVQKYYKKVHCNNVDIDYISL
mmetsp:Transcript_35407/g.46741  ORF Transcript_35407/g.46741 Transcript_35407/m.46741 type:complete len:452 (+) Transcript_35407:509-1864(+)